jgi:glycosyltransferase involved in cell wall biosynthesis
MRSLNAGANKHSAEMPVTIILPCWNECRSIEPLIGAFREAFRPGEDPEVHLLFVDDASTDGTWSEIEQVLGRYGQLFVSGLRLPAHLGKASAQAAGLRSLVPARGPVVFMDSDGQHDPGVLLPPIHRSLETGRTQIAERSGYRRTLTSQLGTVGLRILGNLAGASFQPKLAEFLAISAETANRLASNPQLGISPLLPLVQSCSPDFDTFQAPIGPRIDGSTSSRWSTETHWQKAVLHLLVNPWRLLLRLSVGVTIMVAIMGTYGLVVGITSMANGTFLGVGSVLVALVFIFAVLATLQIIILALLALVLRRVETIPTIAVTSAQRGGVIDD